MTVFPPESYYSERNILYMKRVSFLHFVQDGV